MWITVHYESILTLPIISVIVQLSDLYIRIIKHESETDCSPVISNIKLYFKFKMQNNLSLLINQF